MDQAIHPPAIRKRRLHRIGIRRQGLGHDVMQLNLAKSSTRLLVGQNVLQTQHIARQLFNVCLRLVDGFQPLLQVPQAARRPHRGTLQGLAHEPLHLGQAVLHQLDHRGLRQALRLGDVMEAACQPLLPFRQALHALRQPGHFLHQQGRHPARGAQHHQQQAKYEHKHPARQQNLRRVPRVGLPEQGDHRRPNNRSISASFSST